ncbi:MAG: mechanosensitive ion channel family protein [Acidobacteria bacterium]|nr:mechanosensitive ion channel family protein [Bryobacteraceae bacterium CoA2 C42]
MNWNFNGLEALSVFCGSILVLLIVRWWILRGLFRAATGPDSFPHIVWQYLKTPSLFWVLAASVQLGIEAFVVDPRWRNLAEDSIVGFVIFSMALMLNAMVQRGISRLPFAMAGLSRTLTRLIVFGIGLLILLRIWGISITPILTALGVGGLAVALALQDTLGNLFAGVHLLVEAPISVGQFIRLSAEEEGTVTDIGWRTTRIQTPNNSTIIVPNKTITNGTLLNYDLPQPRVATGIPILLGHAADLTLAEKICVEAAKAHPQVLPDAEPLLVADPGITPTHLQFRLVFQVEKQLGSSLIRSAILKTILQRFRQENIPLPELPGRP